MHLMIGFDRVKLAKLLSPGGSYCCESKNKESEDNTIHPSQNFHAVKGTHLFQII